MSKHRDLGPLVDMRAYCARVMRKTSQVSRSDFDADENLQLAVTHLVQIIGEAAARVTEETCAAHPEIDWPNIVGMRNRIVHDYGGIAIGRIWDIATADVPRLLTALQSFVPSDPP